MVASDDFWKALRSHLDQNYNGIISQLAKNSKISETDLKFIELTCCGFNYVEIAIVLGYNPKYISQKRNDIAAKLRLRVPLRDYLEDAMTKQ